MGPKRDDSNQCKWCRKGFHDTPNPMVQNPGPKDMLKRRTPLSNECKPCFNYQGASSYGTLTKSALTAKLSTDEGFNEYIAGLDEYVESRRAGKRPRRQS